MNNQQSKSSFVIQPYRRKYLAEYFRRMSTDNLSELWDDNVARVLEEQGFYAPTSPRSVYKVEKLYASLAKYEPQKAPRVDMNDEAIHVGVNLAYACFARPRDVDVLELPAFTPKLVLSITSNKGGSAGLTAWGQTKAESYVRAYERGLQQMQGEKSPDPCVAFKRTQFNDKTRLVWGYPYAMTALEGIFARPLINWFKHGNSPMAFGMPTGVLGSKLRVSSRHKEWAYSTDVSSYDSSISSSLIVSAFRILATWFNLDEIEPTSGVPYRKIWDDVVHYFIHTPIVMPDGNLYKGKRHGVPSGSYFTQMIDSVVNVIVVGAISHHFSLHCDKEDIYVLGDDILFWSNRKVPLEDIAGYATNLFGMTFNSAKSDLFHWDETIHYLGRDWEKGVPTLSSEEILSRMVQPESYRKYPKEKTEIERQVRMMLLSYAAVYKHAYSIYIESVGAGRRYVTTNASIESDVYFKDKSDHQMSELNPNAMTGLQRYMRRYVWEKSDGLGPYTPLALQFWK